MTAPWGPARASRLFSRRDAEVQLDDDGFLNDPSSRWGSVINPHVVGIDTLRESRCLVVVGEPGAGKSDILRQHAPLLLEVNSVMPVVKVDLAEYGTEDRLARALFENPEVNAWRAGQGELCVMLDSLDECQERVSHIATVLGAELARWPTDRLHLRICCRTADWPESLQATLARDFEEVSVFELLPLTRDGVATLCAAAAVPAEQFMAAVREARVGPLAAKPLTLELLLRLYAPDGQLPSDVGRLYHDALLQLAEEPTQRRREAQPSGRLSGTSRVAVASRLAALSTLGHRAAFWTGRPDQRPESDLATRDCVGGSEPNPAAALDVSEDAVRETLRTGLFNGRGVDRIGWAHHTFAEHLTARFILTNELHERQVSSLLIATDGQVYPQLHSVAAWLLALAADGQYDWIIEQDPELLLTSPVTVARQAVRERAVTRLFSLAATGEYHRRFGHRLDGLANPALGAAVRTKLRVGTPEERRLAFEIAQHCVLPGLRHDLLSIVRDETRPNHERVDAAQALRTIAPQVPTTELVAIATAPSAENDPNDELKGCAMWLSWPHAMTNREALDSLTPPRRSNFFGAYASFIEFQLSGALGPSDVEAAMEWLINLERTGRRHERFDRIADRIVQLALDAAEDPRTADQLARLLLARQETHEALFVDTYLRDEPKPTLTTTQRHSIAAAAIRHVAPDDADELVRYGPQGPGILTRDDLAWLIGRFDSEPDQRPVTTRLVELIFHPSEPGHSHLVLDLPEDHPLRSSIGLAYWLTPVALDSDLARQARAHQQMFRDRTKQVETESPPTNEEIEDKVRRWLDQLEGGDPAGFWQACYLLYLPPGAAQFSHEIDPDLTAQPRWKTLSNDTRRRMLAAGQRYLEIGSCSPDDWLGKNINYRPAHAGYRALLLIARLDPDALSIIPAHIWNEWAPIIIAEFTAHGAGTWEDKKLLLDRALPHASEELSRAAIGLIKGNSSRGETIHQSREIEHIWSPRLSTWLSQALAKTELDEATATDAAALLARRDPAAARPLLHAVLKDDAADSQRRADAGALLLAHDGAASWAALRAVLDANPELGEQIMVRHASGMFYSERAPALDDEDLADLYIWLVRWFPFAEDPDFDEVHLVGPREQIARWRDNLLSRLEDQATASSVNAIRRIEAALPEFPWIRTRRRDAETKLRRSTWEPVDPDDLLTLARSGARRLVTSTKDLSDVALEALRTIQARLTGETPDANLLWDTRSAKPKSEEEISDYLRNRLHDLLVEQRVVVSREVQVRSFGPGIGERTDLRIDAVTPGDAPAVPLTVIVEVKGSWNRKLKTDLREQLVDRYMRDVRTSHGIYLVAWPSRLRSGMDEERIGFLADEARRLANDGTHVTVVHLDFDRTRPPPT